MNRISPFLLLFIAGCITSPPSATPDTGNGDDGGLVQDLGVIQDVGQVEDMTVSDAADMQSSDLGYDLGADAGTVVRASSSVDLLDHLWLFENSLTNETSSASFTSISAQFRSDAAEGDAGLQLNPMTLVNVEDPEIGAFREARIVTVGGWVFDESSQETASYITRLDPGGWGWAIVRTSTGVGCFTRSTEGKTSESLTEDVPTNSWNHIVCVFKYVETEVIIQTIVNGTEGTSITSAYSEPDAVLKLGSAATGPFQGGVDEIFVTHSVLDIAAIKKIHACGTDGSLCRCDPQNPEMYVDCGRSSPTCDMLPPCLGTVNNF